MTDLAAVKDEIEAAWDARDGITPSTKGKVRDAVDHAIELLDSGQFRVADKGPDGEWVTHQWLKKAVLLSFRLNANRMMLSDAPASHTLLGTLGGEAVVGDAVGPWWDKVPNKFQDWTETKFLDAGFRAVPGSIVRRGAYIGKNVILMPSFVNIGAWVGEGTMVDTWATVGSCAQIGKNVHLSGGAGIGGVLEPLQANPTIIEDGCFIGARAEVAEGVIVGEGAVLAMGVYLSGSTKIVDRETGEVFRGKVPPYSVVVPGSLPDPKGGPSLYCAVIVKRVDAQTRAKTGVNELLRD
jgi:2,3,4,5-tetrahydropyridine-2-carboxylate N-succinyltransferase